MCYAQSEKFNRIYDFSGSVELSGKVSTVNDGYILVGSLFDQFPYPAIIAKLDISGQIVWTKEFNAFGGSTPSGRTESLVTTDTSVTIASWLFDTTNAPYPYIMNFTEEGDSLWADTLDVWGNYFAITKTNDGNLLAAGRIKTSTHLMQILVCKYSMSGERLWMKSYGAFNHDDECYSISRCPDGGFVLGCYSKSWSDSNPNIIKIDNLGNVEWEKELELSEWNEPYAVTSVNNDGDIFIGSSQVVKKVNSFEYSRYWFAKLNPMGDTVWTMPYGDTAWINGTYDVVERRNGNLLFLLFGEPQLVERAIVIEMDTSGNILSEILFTHDTSSSAIGPNPRNIDTTLDNGFIVAGHFNYLNNTSTASQKLWVVKFDSNGCYDSTFNCVVGVSELQQESHVFEMYPNPASHQVTVNTSKPLQVYNSLGQPSPCPQRQLGNAIEMDISGLSHGIYFIRSEGEGEIRTGKLVKE
jgi:hypothetical protein